MARRVLQLIADHAGDAQVVVLRSRRAVRRYLAGVATPGRLPRRWLPVRSAPSPFTDPVRGLLYASADQIAQDGDCRHLEPTHIQTRTA